MNNKAVSLPLPKAAEPKKKKSPLMGRRFQFENCCRILERHPHWKGRFGYDLRDDCPTLDGKRLTDEDEGMIRRWFSANRKMNVGKDTVHEAVKQAFMNDMYDPVKIMLDNLSAWDGTDRISTLLEIMHIKIYNDEYRKYARAFWDCYLISAVRRVYEPGCKVDDVPILWGAQGLYKTTFFYELFYGRVSVTCLNLNDHRQSVMALYGVWCFLLDEVKSVTRHEESQLKSYITKTEDRYDKKNARYVEVRPRRNVFGITTNDPKMFKERGGLRRYHSFHLIEQINIDWVKANRDQLWAQVKVMYQSGTTSFIADPSLLKTADKYQRKISLVNEVWEDTARDFLQDNHTSEKVQSSDIKEQLRLKGFTVKSDKELGNGMRNIGCFPTKLKRERAWTNPFHGKGKDYYSV
jgi:putative DNA primase/helicase